MNEEELEPKISPQFWFDLSKTLVENVPDKINESASQFEKLLLWLWGVYTPLVGIGTSAISLWANTPSPGTMVLLLLPCVLLLFAYWFVSKAKSTVLVEFSPDAFDSIERAYQNIIQTKNEYFEKAQKITLITCAIVPLSIFSYYLDLRPKSQSEPSLSIGKTFIDQKQILIVHVSGDFQVATEKEPIHIQILSTGQEIPTDKKAFLNPKANEVIEIRSNLESPITNVDVKLHWKESTEIEKTWTKSFKW